MIEVYLHSVSEQSLPGFELGDYLFGATEAGEVVGYKP